MTKCTQNMFNKKNLFVDIVWLSKNVVFKIVTIAILCAQYYIFNEEPTLKVKIVVILKQIVLSNS